MTKKVFRYILAVFFSAAVFIGWSAAATKNPELRVAVVNNVEQFDLEIIGRYTLTDKLTGKELEEARRSSALKVRPSGRGILVGSRDYPSTRLDVLPHFQTRILINGREYLGHVQIIRTNQGKLTVVNFIDLEQYIKGVLYHEVSHRWPMDALKVQAVATRTYALYRMRDSAKADFDVTSDIYSQVYGGKDAQRYRTNIAVNRTRGQILTYKGQILPAYFHATCAGATEDADELWETNLPPLDGVVCPYCRQSPHYEWKKNFRSGDVQDQLNARGHKIGLIKEIRVAERNSSGRVRWLEIVTREGKVHKISGKEFRQIIGPNVIKSNNYDIIMKGYYFDVVGKGWGHGVGMCQWGAYFMSLERTNYKEILQFYYPGTEIVRY